MARVAQFHTQATLLGPTSLAWQGMAGLSTLGCYSVISQSLVDSLALLPSGNVAEIDTSRRWVVEFFSTVKDTTLYHVRMVTDADQVNIPKLIEVLVMKDGERKDNPEGYQIQLGTIWKQSESPGHDWEGRKFVRRSPQKGGGRFGFLGLCYFCCWLAAHKAKKSLRKMKERKLDA
ncbi:hypothetical protein BGZ60DRAFT_438161 [Tricladium varicosporioides]|nr:hypothetical protein BGZ60DRAFT_438161 [Hymenoscyphus varicosporioides]